MEHGKLLNAWRDIKVCVWRVDKIEINNSYPLEFKSGFSIVVSLVHEIKTSHLHLSSLFTYPTSHILKQRNSACDGTKAKMG